MFSFSWKVDLQQSVTLIPVTGAKNARRLSDYDVTFLQTAKAFLLQLDK